MQVSAIFVRGHVGRRRVIQRVSVGQPPHLVGVEDFARQQRVGNVDQPLLVLGQQRGAALVLVVDDALHFGVDLQRGVLATGIMNPDVDKNKTADLPDRRPADFNLSLINSKGEEVSMEQLKGKVVFMNIWATWCPPCIAEMPGINDLFNAVKDENVVFLMISVDQDFEKAKRFNERKGFDFEIYKIDGGIPQMYYTESIPTTFVISARGQLVFVHEGMADYDTNKFKAFLRSLK